MSGKSQYNYPAYMMPPSFTSSPSSTNIKYSAMAKKQEWVDDLYATVLVSTNILKFFPNLSEDLLRLAVTPEWFKLSQLPQRYQNIGIETMARVNYEALEFYGDVVLSMIVAEEILDSLGLNATPGELTQLNTSTVKNDNLAKVGRALGICEFFPKDNKACADIIEALLGAIYVEYGLKEIENMRDWLFSLPTFNDTFEKQLDKISHLSTLKSLKQNFGITNSYQEPRNTEDKYQTIMDYLKRNRAAIVPGAGTRNNTSLYLLNNATNAKVKILSSNQPIKIWYNNDETINEIFDTLEEAGLIRFV